MKIIDFNARITNNMQIIDSNKIIKKIIKKNLKIKKRILKIMKIKEFN